MKVSIKPEEIFSLGNIPITNTLFTSWIVVIIIALVSYIINNALKNNPHGKVALVTELIFEKLMSFLEIFAGGREKVRQFLPIVGTIFFFVLFSNWIGTLPGVETIGIYHYNEGEKGYIPIIRTVFSDLNMTLVLAIIVVITTHFVGLKSIGFKAHVGKFLANPLKSPVKFFVGLLEIIGELSKVISLTFRLFGNIFAGSVLMLIVTDLVPFIVPIPFLGLELFVGFIQALVFAVLAMLFIASSTHIHEEAH